jgi:hypothetical protein
MAETVTVSVAQGGLRGRKVTTVLATTYYSFRGIPYAKPPLGSFRFRVSEYKKGYVVQNHVVKTKQIRNTVCVSRPLLHHRFGSEFPGMKSGPLLGILLIVHLDLVLACKRVGPFVPVSNSDINIPDTNCQAIVKLDTYITPVENFNSIKIMFLKLCVKLYLMTGYERIV